MTWHGTTLAIARENINRVHFGCIYMIVEYIGASVGGSSATFCNVVLVQSDSW
jgi:hypothetical protein